MKSMKHIFLATLAIACVAFMGLLVMPSTPARATAYQGANLQLGGGDMLAGSYIALGNYAGASSGIVVHAIALCTITKGDLVVGPFGTTYTARMGVSKTTTAGDVTALGVAYESAAYGTDVRIVTYGVARVACGTGHVTTVGETFGASGVAGQVTPTSTLTAGTYTSLSRSPIKVLSLEARTVGADQLFLGCVNCR